MVVWQRCFCPARVHYSTDEPFHGTLGEFLFVPVDLFICLGIFFCRFQRFPPNRRALETKFEALKPSEKFILTEMPV